MSNDSRSIFCSIASVGLLFASGCYTGVVDDGIAGGGGTESGGTAGTDTSGGSDPAAELPAPTTRFFRLTHQQWENTVEDLFYLDQPTGLSELFRTDPYVSGFMFDNNALSLEVDEALWTGYRLASAQLAEMVVADPDLKARILPPDGGDPVARARQFVQTFGSRAYRRPLGDAEVEELVAQFDGASPLYSGIDPFDAGVRHIVETVLQSPHFIYRVEESSDVAGDVIPLTDYEIASRLSYFLWNTMPDDDLFAVAAGGGLTDVVEVEDQALRMLADPRAEAVVGSFHAQLLEVEDFASIAPSAAFFPDVSQQLGEYAIHENELFIRDLVFDNDGSWADMLTSNETFVNAELAAIYGVDGNFGDAFQKVALDPTRRAGIFTQVGFLASNATSVDPDPIHRGVFMARRVVCLTIAAPPDNVPPLPPLQPDQTNRERVEAHTQQEGSVCSSCHSTMINPLGFAFENYDAIGGFRTMDNGKPVNAASDPFVGKMKRIHVENALDLVTALADSPDVHECYMKHWIEFASGRPFVPEDRPLAARLGTESIDGQTPIKELLVRLVTSKPFLSRATEELP